MLESSERLCFRAAPNFPLSPFLSEYLDRSGGIATISSSNAALMVVAKAINPISRAIFIQDFSC